MLFPVIPLAPESSDGAALFSYVVGYAAVSGCMLLTGSRAPSSLRAWLVCAPLAVGALSLFAFLGARAGALSAAAILCALLSVGTATGAVIGARIEHPGHLSIVAIVSSIADLASVLAPSGPSHEIAAHPDLLALLALAWPMLGTERIEPLIGVGDVVFVALYLAAAARHGLGRGRTLAALSLGLAVTAGVVILSALPVPALPFLGAAMVLAHPASRLPPRHERAKAALALLVFVAVFVTLALVRWSG